MKRFTETDKWVKDRWFTELSLHNKLFWFYILDTCDNVGVWEVSVKMASMLIGYEYSIDTLCKDFEEKIHVFENGRKWWITTFVPFQHGKLDRESQSKPILSYIMLLEKHGLDNLYSMSMDSNPKGYAKGIGTLQGKGKNKGKGNRDGRKPGTKDQAIAYCIELGLSESDGVWIWDKWEGNGFKNNGKNMSSWKATVRSWKGSRYFPSQHISSVTKQGSEQPLEFFGKGGKGG